MSGNNERIKYAPKCPRCGGITREGNEQGVWVFSAEDNHSIMCLNYDRNTARNHGEFNFFLPKNWTHQQKAVEVIRLTRQIVCEVCRFTAPGILANVLFTVLKNEIRRYPEFRSRSER